MTYDVDYFIKKFEAIPENKWCINSRGEIVGGIEQRCALGWCYPTFQEAKRTENYWNEDSLEDKALMGMFKSVLNIKPPLVNNGLAKNYPQPTPKQRILAALYDIKKLQEPKVKEVIRYVAVDAEIRKQTKKLEGIDN